MSKGKNQLSEETMKLYLIKKAYQVYPTATGSILTTDWVLANSFGKEITMAFYDWDKHL